MPSLVSAWRSGLGARVGLALLFPGYFLSLRSKPPSSLEPALILTMSQIHQNLAGLNAEC